MKKMSGYSNRLQLEKRKLVDNKNAKAYKDETIPIEKEEDIDTNISHSLDLHNLEREKELK